MVDGLFRRAFVSSGVKGGGGEGGERQFKNAGMLILLFKVVKLGWVLGEVLDGYGLPGPQILQPVLEKNILKEYPTKEITTSRALSFQSFYAFKILYHFLGDVSNWIFTPFFIMSPKIMTLLGGTFAKRYFGEVPLPRATFRSECQ